MYYVSNEDGEIHNSKDVLCFYRTVDKTIIDIWDGDLFVCDTVTGYETIQELLKAMN